jgi:hypothetical protein
MDKLTINKAPILLTGCARFGAVRIRRSSGQGVASIRHGKQIVMVPKDKQSNGDITPFAAASALAISQSASAEISRRRPPEPN